MIKIPFDEIVIKIQNQANISKEEINIKIKEKMDQLSGLISKEGAAHIIANELKVKLFEEGTIKIADIRPGMISVETIGKVTNIYDVKEFTRKSDGGSGKVTSFFIADESDKIRIVLWNDHTDLLTKINVGDIVKVSNCNARENNNGCELHFYKGSEMEVNPAGISMGKIKDSDVLMRKSVEKLNETDNNVEVLATIVQVFEPRFYEVCPECNKRIRNKDGAFRCDVHGEVTVNFAYVMNTVLDDGTGTIRSVFFRDQVRNLTGLDHDNIMKYKDTPSEFSSIKDELLGRIVKVSGRTRMNQMFNRLEFISSAVDPSPDANEELKKLEKEASVIE